MLNGENAFCLDDAQQHFFRGGGGGVDKLKV
jgi:hypothetical protein